jgi:hypothetical protein
MATGDLITIDRAIMNQTLYDLNGTDPEYLERIITVSSTAIKNECHRDFTSTSYTEYYSGGNYPYEDLQLRQYPVLSISRLAANPQQVMLVQNTDTTTNQRATVSTTSTGVVLNRVHSGVTATNTLLYADNVTLTALAVAVSAVGNGWAATVTSGYGNHPSADITPIQGALAAMGPSGGGSLEMYLDDGQFLGPFINSADDLQTFPMNSWRLDAAAGIIRGYFPKGTLNIRVDYTAGFATIPEPIQQACLMVSQDIAQSDLQNAVLKSEKLGPFEKVYNDSVKQITRSPKVMALISPYIAWDKSFGGR